MDPRPGRYRHFKGKEYRLLSLATHSETLEPMVVYQALYGEQGIWVRPLSMWTEEVEREGRRCPRFVYIGEWERHMKAESIDRINELARKAKSPEGLTAEEKAEQQKLRAEYVAAFRASLQAQLDNVRLVDEEGNQRPLEKKKTLLH